VAQSTSKEKVYATWNLILGQTCEANGRALYGQESDDQFKPNAAKKLDKKQILKLTQKQLISINNLITHN
jgi:hypothetical protein